MVILDSHKMHKIKISKTNHQKNMLTQLHPEFHLCESKKVTVCRCNIKKKTQCWYYDGAWCDAMDTHTEHMT